MADALNERGALGQGLARCWCSGSTYKQDVDDVRESPALDIIKLLETRGARVAYHDPHVPQATMEHEGFDTPSATLEGVEDFDCVVIATTTATSTTRAWSSGPPSSSTRATPPRTTAAATATRFFRL